jgi:hypothetical protein
MPWIFLSALSAFSPDLGTLNVSLTVLPGVMLNLPDPSE